MGLNDSQKQALIKLLKIDENYAEIETLIEILELMTLKSGSLLQKTYIVKQIPFERRNTAPDQLEFLEKKGVIFQKKLQGNRGSPRNVCQITEKYGFDIQEIFIPRIKDV